MWCVLGVSEIERYLSIRGERNHISEGKDEYNRLTYEKKYVFVPGGTLVESNCLAGEVWG